jgi:hypothetical protein
VRKQEFLPVALLGVIAGFIVVQAVSMRDSRPHPSDSAAASAPAVEVAAGSAGAVTDSARAIPPQVANNVASDSGGLDDLDVVRVSSREPPPVRDLATVQMLVRDGSPGTYLPNMLVLQDDLLFRWPDRRANAIRVWIERDPAIPDWDSDYAVVAEHAFEEWQQAGFPLRFLVLRDSASTEIKIRWITSFPDSGSKLGMTRRLTDQHGWIHAAELTVATHDATGRRLPPAVVAGTARHEIGHALGLGHSSDATDVMYPESRTTAISAADRATLRLLYILPPGSVR